MDAELQSRLSGIEARLAQLEMHLGLRRSPTATLAQPESPAQPAAPRGPDERGVGMEEDEGGASLATSVLGWGGAIALVLAGAYLIRLAIDTGWLTPQRQVGLAALAGLGLIGAGFALRPVNRRYAGLLPAAGVAVLFLCVYGGHLYYGFLGARTAAVTVVCICAASLWLCRAFRSDLYALFAVAGSYSAPFLLATLRGSTTDLVVYFSAWSVVFSVYAIWHGRRLVYLLALYLALIGFDVLARQHAPDEWGAALFFQTAQFLIFGAATALFSIRRGEPLGQDAAIAHLPALLLFYLLQYTLLSQHLPGAAPWIAVASLAVVAVLYGIARAALARPLPGGELLLWSYVAVVLLHAGYIESVPKAWAPWFAFIVVPIVAALALRGGRGMAASWPAWIAVGAIFAVNYLRVVFDTDLQSVPGRQALAAAYALLLYAAYAFVGKRDDGGVRLLILYAGHVCTMAAAVHFIDLRIAQSAAWGVLALACLGVALSRRDRLLGQSSLLVFGSTAAKVLLYDLSGAPPVARILSLLVLGVTFYFGGLLYQRVLGGAKAA